MRKPPKRRRKASRKRREKDFTGLYLYKIKITYEDDFHPFDFILTEEIADTINKYGLLCKENPRKAARELPAVIKRYPEVPMLRNHLFAALKRLGKIEEAYAVNDLALQDHPDYIFAVVNKAIQFWEKEEYDEVERIFGGRPLSINRTFPKRKLFHVREVFAYDSFLVQFWLSKGSTEAAESHYNILEELAPGHPELAELRKLIDMHFVKKTFSDMIKKIDERRAKRKKRALIQKPKKKRDPNQENLFEQ